MSTVVSVDCTAEVEVKSVLHIIERPHAAEEVVVEVFATYYIRSLYIHLLTVDDYFFRQVIAFQLGIVFELFVITRTFSVMQSRIHRQLGHKKMREVQLYMVLSVVVRLVVVEPYDIAAFVVVCSCGVEASVGGKLLLTDTVPSHIGFLFASKHDKFHHTVCSDITCRSTVRVKVAKSTLEVTVGIDFRELGIEDKTRRHYACTDFYYLTQSIVHTTIEADRGIRTLRNTGSLHIDACSKGSRAVGRCTYTTLYLNAFQARGKIGHIHPKHRLALRIVEGYTIDGHIDTCMVCTAYAEISISYTQTVIGGGYERRYRRKQKRQILPEILLREPTAAYITCRQVVAIGIAGRNHRHLFERLYVDGIVIVTSP